IPPPLPSDPTVRAPCGQVAASRCRRSSGCTSQREAGATLHTTLGRGLARQLFLQDLPPASVIPDSTTLFLAIRTRRRPRPVGRLVAIPAMARVRRAARVSLTRSKQMQPSSDILRRLEQAEQRLGEAEQRLGEAEQRGRRAERRLRTLGCLTAA